MYNYYVNFLLESCRAACAAMKVPTTTKSFFTRHDSHCDHCVPMILIYVRTGQVNTDNVPVACRHWPEVVDVLWRWVVALYWTPTPPGLSYTPDVLTTTNSNQGNGIRQQVNLVRQLRNYEYNVIPKILIIKKEKLIVRFTWIDIWVMSVFVPLLVLAITFIGRLSLYSSSYHICSIYTLTIITWCLDRQLHSHYPQTQSMLEILQILQAESVIRINMSR